MLPGEGFRREPCVVQGPSRKRKGQVGYIRKRPLPLERRVTRENASTCWGHAYVNVHAASPRVVALNPGAGVMVFGSSGAPPMRSALFTALLPNAAATHGVPSMTSWVTGRRRQEGLLMPSGYRRTIPRDLAASLFQPPVPSPPYACPTKESYGIGETDFPGIGRAP